MKRAAPGTGCGGQDGFRVLHASLAILSLRAKHVAISVDELPMPGNSVVAILGARQNMVCEAHHGASLLLARERPLEQCAVQTKSHAHRRLSGRERAAGMPGRGGPHYG